MMVVQAHEREVVKVGGASGLPGQYVVDVGEGDLVQPGKRQWRSRRITSRRWASEGSRLARPSYMVCPTSSSTAMAMVASQAIRRTTSVLIRRHARGPRPGRSSRPPRRGGRRGRCGRPRRRGWRCCPGPGLPVPPPDHLDEGVTEALVPRGLPVRGDLVARASRQARVSAKDSAGSWTLIVRNASLKRTKRRSCWERPGDWPARIPAAAAAAGHVAQLAHRVLLGHLGELSVALGGGHVGQHLDLVQGHLPGAERAHQVGQVPGLLAHLGERPGARDRDPVALDDQVSPTSPLVAVGLAPADLAQGAPRCPPPPRPSGRRTRRAPRRAPRSTRRPPGRSRRRRVGESGEMRSSGEERSASTPRDVVYSTDDSVALASVPLARSAETTPAAAAIAART